ncbi:MAG TPA: hypothetical protein VNK04_19980 [Gemmataceae bacterium]|nr:hypothetical protein [Gemmataceae bacterium]
MTRSQANLVGGAVVGAFFVAVAAGLIGFALEVEGRDLSVGAERRRNATDSDVRQRYPPSALMIGLVFLAGGAAGAVLGLILVIVLTLFLGPRRESYLIDGVGGLGGALLGVCVGLLLTQTPLLRKDDPWGPAIVWSAVGAGAVVGLVQGIFFGAGVRHLLMGRLERDGRGLPSPLQAPSAN